MVANSTATFEMRSAREATVGGLEHIEQQIVAIEQAMQENPAFVFDLSRSLVESACKSILSERSISFGSGDDLPKLLKALTQQMPILPVAESQATDVRNSLVKTIGGLHMVIQGICELRNKTGFSHGSEGHRPRLGIVQARMAAEAADSIVGFLYRIHTQDRTLPVRYEDNSEFNDWLDEEHGEFQIIDVEFKASDVLFQMEPEAYRVHLVDFRNQNERQATMPRDEDL